ncbi:hypothetical protein LCGC14_3040210, partial [marine sediment metagenome]
DNSAGGGTQWADGTVRVTQARWGLIWDHGDGVYKTDADLDIGDGSTSTYLTSTVENVIFVGAAVVEVHAAATLQIGALTDSWGVDGSSWHLGGPDAGSEQWGKGGTVLVYASKIYNAVKCEQRLQVGVFKTKNSIFHATWTAALNDWQRRFNYGPSLTTLEIEDMYIAKSQNTIFEDVPGVIDNIQSHAGRFGVQTTQPSVEVTGIRVTSANVNDVRVWTAGPAADLTLTDPKATTANPDVAGNAASFIQEQYTCNIHVADRAGNNLATVNIGCDSDGEGDVFDVNTDANGDIAEQKVPFKKWVGESETLTSFSPHTFTISKAGYETLILEVITVDHPIVWHLELQRSASLNSGLIG